jgi:DNA-binding response OmpR family regulator
VIALGNLAGELKTALEAAVRAAGLELLLTREPARAFVELERDGALAVLVDMATLGAEQFCKRARGTERLRSVPVIGMSRHPNELGFARVFAWGADDLVPLGARLPLERRLQVLRDTPPADTTGFGQAVVAEATTQRRALVGRVLSQAGYDVKFAVDRGAVELYASQSETRLVVISAALGDPRRIIEAAAKAGALPTWIVTVEARSTARLAASLAGLDRVAVTSTAGSPEDVLFLANELVFSKGTRRREWRALYATPVAFRPAGGDSDEYGFSYDASPRGLYVRSLLPCATESVEVELRLPSRDERVRLSGKVAKRFAFGSGAIASAPPGFSVHLEGPEDALGRWMEACSELIAAASSESLPPRPRSPSQPVLQSPGLGAREVALAVPPATVSIESVVAPLPIEAKPAADETTDVGELLAATLDEQTLTEFGTRPVTIDRDGGVREERPSEFGAGLSSLVPPSEPAPDLSIPPPVSAPSAPPAEDAATLPPPVEQAPATPHSIDWDADAKTAVRESQPFLSEPAQPLPASDAEPPSLPFALAAADPAPLPARNDEPSVAEPPAEKAPALAPEKEVKPAAFAATVLGPPPVPRRSMGSAPNIGVAPPPPPPRSSPKTAVAPPAAAAPSSPGAPGNQETLPLGFQKQPAPIPIPEPPRAARHEPRAVAPAPPRRSRFWVFLTAAVGATVLGVGAGFVLHKPAPGAGTGFGAGSSSPAATTAPPTVAPETASVESNAPSSPPATAPIASGPAAAPPPTARASAETALPSSSASAPPAAVATAAPAPAAPSPATSVDLRRLAADRSALIVHSSVSAHVFVHGTDYGETNRPLVTSCGIRFVRLGRAPGDFLEPGRSYVLKCGRLNELSIEP